jgi:hypothetical protein
MKTAQETKIVIPESEQDFNDRVAKATSKGKSADSVVRGRESVSETQYEVIKKEALEHGQEPPEVLVAQTFTRYIAETPADFALIIDNDTEQVNIFQRALASKESAIMRDMLLDPDFQPVEGSYDLKSDLCKAAEGRQKMSDEDKALKVLLKLSPEQIAAVMAQLPSGVAA